jgi:signal transduction histidine kinase
VRADVSGVSPTEASYGFVLLPHYYETAWFRALSVAAAMLLGWMAYQLRVRQLRSRFALILKERLRLAREIHDTLAQAFVGISAQLDALETCLPEDLRPAHIYLDLARRMAQHSLTEARRSVMDLRSAALTNQGLPAALESGARNWAEGSPVRLHIAVTGEVRSLPEDVEQNLLRIAQEAVTNAQKHASPSKISVTLHGEGKTLKLNVADDGCGFEPDDAFAGMGGHFGLIGIRERAERIGGELRLDSHPGRGTNVEVTVPLP